MPEISLHADWLTTYFHSLALDRQNVENKAAGRKVQPSISEGRLEKFHQSAIELLLHHPLAEVVEVIDWVYIDCNGYLPQSLVDRNKDHKLTRLRQILNCYEGLREAMTTGIPRPSDQQPKKVDPTEVDELMAAFTEFRASHGDLDISEFRLNNWRKTFRIMLRKYPVQDIKAVIAAIRGMPDYIDQGRYRNAYALNRPGEWEDLREVVKTHELIKTTEAAQPQVVPSRKADADDWVDEDDARRPGRPQSSRNDPWETYPNRPRRAKDPQHRGQAITFSDPERIKLRRLRYEAGLPTSDVGPATGDAKRLCVRDVLDAHRQEMRDG